MIILSILIAMKATICISLIILIVGLRRQRKIELKLLTGLLNDLHELYWSFESKASNNTKDIRAIKESMVGYEFALKTFEDYMKAKLDK